MFQHRLSRGLTRKYKSVFSRMQATNPMEYKRQKGELGKDGYIPGAIAKRVERTEQRQKNKKAKGINKR